MIATARTLNPWFTLALIVCVCVVLAEHRWVAPRLIARRRRRGRWPNRPDGWR